MAAIEPSQLDKAYLSESQIHHLTAETYFQAATQPDCNMSMVTELLESIRKGLIEYRHKPYKAWYDISLDRHRYDKEPFLSLLLDLKNRYYSASYAQQTGFLKDQFSLDAEAAFDRWLYLFADALWNYEEGMLTLFFDGEIAFTASQREKLKEYDRFCKYVVNYRDDSAFPYYERLAASEVLPMWLRSVFEANAGEALLYNFRAWESKKYIEKALEMDANTSTYAGFGNYYNFADQFDNAKRSFQRAIDLDPRDITGYLMMGDVFKKEGQLEMAEQWYEETLNNNFLYIFPYQRLIALYGDWDSAPEKREKIPQLVSIGESKRTRLQDYELYEIYRAAGTANSNFGDHAAAEKWLGAAISLIPEHSNARLDLGYEYAYQGRYDESLAEFGKLLTQDPQHFDAGWGLAWVYEKKEDYPMAIEAYERLAKMDPNRADRSFNGIGVILSVQKQYDKAAGYFRNAIEKYPYEPVYYENLMDMLPDEEKEKESEALYGRMVELFADFPNYAEYLTNLGKLYEKKGDAVRAGELYTKAYERKPGAETLNQLGSFYYSQQDWRLAADAFKRVIDMRKGGAADYENLGLTHEKLGDYVAAEKAFLTAVELEPTASRWLNRLGIFKYNRENYESAAGYFQKAIDKSREHEDVENESFYYNLGMSYELIGKWDEALDAYKQLAALVPDELVYQLKVAYCLHNTRNFEGALEVLLREKGRSGDNPVFYQYLGSTLENLERTEEAAEVYQKAMADFPDDGYFPWRLSVFLKEKGDEANLRTARTLIEKAIAINPDNYNYRFVAGQVYKLLKEWEEARKQYAFLVSRNESSAFYQNEYGVLLCEVGEFPEAIPVFKEAIRLNDAMPLYYQNMANAYIAMGEEQNAAEAFDKASQLEMELSPAGRN